jgi:hypothetical protein
MISPSMILPSGGPPFGGYRFAPGARYQHPMEFKLSLDLGFRATGN